MTETNAINPKAIQIAFLIPDQSWASTAISPAEIFHGMQLSAKAFQNNNYRGFESTFLRCTMRKVSGFSGLPISTIYFGNKGVVNKHFDVVIIPSIWNLSLENLKESKAALEWLREQHDRGSIIVGLVTGVFYLAEAALLNNREATIHWASANIFKQRYPLVKVRPKLQLVEANNIITTSSTPATFDVALLVIQRLLGDRSAEYASHYFTIREKDAPLPEFLEPSCNDILVDAARDFIRMNYAEDISLNYLADQLSVTPRTLSRHFVTATDLNPIQFLTKHRLNIARSLLQSTDFQIQQIAEQSGFSSATVFCRNFKKEFAQTPRQFRDTLPHTK